jgi:hypothetical protein
MQLLQRAKVFGNSRHLYTFASSRMAMYVVLLLTIELASQFSGQGPAAG